MRRERQGQASAVSGTARQIIEKALCDKGLAAERSVISQLLQNDQGCPCGTLLEPMRRASTFAKARDTKNLLSSSPFRSPSNRKEPVIKPSSRVNRNSRAAVNSAHNFFRYKNLRLAS